MAAKKPEVEEEIKMEPFDKEYVVIETAYDTYKLRRPRGPNAGRNHLRLVQKWSSKLTFNESMVANRQKVIEALVKSGLKLEEATKLLVSCGLQEPATQAELDIEQERQEKAEEEWYDKVLPEIIVGGRELIEQIPAEDFKPIFMAMYSNIKMRPDYFRLL